MYNSVREKSVEDLGGKVIPNPFENFARKDTGGMHFSTVFS